MNRTLATWLAANPGGAVLVTGLLGLLPLFGLGFAFFLPGAVPALVTLVRGGRVGLMVALGASGLLAAAMVLLGRPIPVGLIYSGWVLGPPLALGWLLGRTQSLSMCLQVATLAGMAMLVTMHLAFGDPQQFWAPFVRDLAHEMQRRGLPMDLEKDGLVETLARTLWGWVAVLTVLLAMCAVLLARWWQSLPERAGSFGTEFQSLRLGMALGLLAALVIGASLVTTPVLIDDLARLFVGALVVVGLAAAHRQAAAGGRLHAGWLWAIYVLLLLVAPFMVAVLATWGFVDNWVRSRQRAPHPA
jgi:hypothetical protein